MTQICVVPAAWADACGFGPRELRLPVISIRIGNGWTFAKVVHPSGVGDWVVNVEMRYALILSDDSCADRCHACGAEHTE